MSIKEIVKSVSSKFVYTSDKKFLIDQWFVMREKEGKLHGDCDDFSVTCLWELCDRNIIKFIVNVLILHRYRLHHVKTSTNGGHVVGYANGLYFDNWTLEALPKEEFLRRTKHKFKFFYPSPMIAIYLLCGLFFR